MSRKKKSLPQVTSNMTLMPEGIELRYTNIGLSLLLDRRIREKLTPSDILLLISMNIASGGKSEVTFGEGLAEIYGFSPATFHRSKKRLLNAGFIQYKPVSHKTTVFKLVHPTYPEETVKIIYDKGLSFYVDVPPKDIPSADTSPADNPTTGT